MICTLHAVTAFLV